jgi:hypothetical protein
MEGYMSERTCKMVRYIYGGLFCLLTAIVGVLLITETLNIYFSASTSPFTRAKVAASLYRISVPLWLWLVSVIAGFIIWGIFPVAPEKRKPMPEDYTLKKLKRRMPRVASGDFATDLNLVEKEEKIIFILKLVWAIMWFAIAIYGIIYFCLPSSFPRTDNADVTYATQNVVKMALHILPFAIVALLYGCFITIYEHKSAKKQYPSVKKLVASSGKGGAAVAKTDCPFIAKVKIITKNKWFAWGIRIALAVLAVAFIIWGICCGGMAYVLANAIKLCTSCIGLG